MANAMLGSHGNLFTELQTQRGTDG